VIAPAATSDRQPADGAWGASLSTTRTLDLRYLARAPQASHRPYFAFVEHLTLDLLQRTGPVDVLDVGCANGAFAHFLATRHPRVRVTGVDTLPQLVADATTRVPVGTFLVGDISARQSLPRRCFDLVTMLTLHTHFDRLDDVLDNVMSLVTENGRAVLFGPFNPGATDVLVRLRTPDAAGVWLPGWNLHSRRTVDELLSARSLTGTYHDYAPTPEWPDSCEDDLRTRRATLDGQPVLLNGAGLLLHFAALDIRRRAVSG
jgi:SAM-dependent methyltransferase